MTKDVVEMTCHASHDNFKYCVQGQCSLARQAAFTYKRGLTCQKLGKLFMVIHSDCLFDGPLTHSFDGGGNVIVQIACAE